MRKLFALLLFITTASALAQPAVVHNKNGGIDTLNIVSRTSSKVVTSNGDVALGDIKSISFETEHEQLSDTYTFYRSKGIQVLFLNQPLHAFQAPVAPQEPATPAPASAEADRAGAPAPIMLEKVFGGLKFSQNGKYLKPKEILALMESNPEAFNAFKKAKSNLDMASVLGFAGGFMVGWPLGAAVAGGEPQWGLAAAGGALVVLSIPFSTGFKKHATKAVDIYNGNNPMARAYPARVTISTFGVGARITIAL